ncbi:MAG: efflux RND transporter periplasmic adaptor subunit [Kiloniellales bacterium]
MAIRRYIVASVILLLVSAGAYWVWEAYLKKEPEAGGGWGNFPVAVDAEPVEVGRVVRSIEAVGTLSANEEILVRPEIDGLLTEIGFQEGQAVELDQVLFRLDDSLLAAELATAQADLSLYRQNHRRAQELHARGAGTERSRDEAVADLQRGRALLKLAEVRLERTVIRAPFEGVVGLRDVSVGDYVQAGEPLVRLEQINPMKVDFRVPELFLSEMARGQSLRLTIDALPGQTFEGQVIAMDPQVDVNGRALVLRALVPNGRGQLRPGLFARVEIILEQHDDALLLPESALVPSGRSVFVYRVLGGKAVRTEVETGLYRAGKVEILSGLSAGELVVTAGQVKLRDGSELKLPEGVESPPAPAVAETAEQAG